MYTPAAGATQPIFNGDTLRGQLDLQKGTRLANVGAPFQYLETLRVASHSYQGIFPLGRPRLVLDEHRRC
jgi:hypothetical protein